MKKHYIIIEYLFKPFVCVGILVEAWSNAVQSGRTRYHMYLRYRLSDSMKQARADAAKDFVVRANKANETGIVE